MITAYFPAPSARRKPHYHSFRGFDLKPGEHFIGVTASGRRVPCTVAADGTFSADSHEVVRLIGWLPL